MEKLTLWSAMKLPNSESYVVAFKGEPTEIYDVLTPTNNKENSMYLLSKPLHIKEGFLVEAMIVTEFDKVYLNTGTEYMVSDRMIGEYE